MIIIPEIQTVLILVPRTGSSSLKRAVRERYPRAMLVYRHMEADGCPHGYDRWRKIGIIRHPVERLWSLYKFCRKDVSESGYPIHAERQARAASKPFDEWILDNEVHFTDPYDANGDGFYPEFTVLHAMPENRKSQFVYLRPDLGTQIYPFERYAEVCALLNVRCDGVHNATDRRPVPALWPAAQDHMRRFFDWDFRYFESPRP